MAGMPVRRERRERTDAWLTSERALDDIIEWMLDGDGGTLTSFCRSEGLQYSVIASWLRADDERLAAYNAALADYADSLALDAVPIADDLVAPEVGEDGLPVQQGPREPSKNEIAAAKVRIDARMRVAGKIGRERWGDKSEVKVSGGLTLAALVAASRQVEQGVTVDGEVEEGV